jgi:hypothetical protein
VRSTVFNFALISVLALLFVFPPFGFNLRLFILLVVLSAFLSASHCSLGVS